jgi:hypothetical protein
MVEWLAGNRIRGTSTERTSTSGFNPVSAISGGWVELGRTTLGSAGDTITVSSLADKRYLMVLGNTLGTGDNAMYFRVGNSTIDTGTNYAYRYSNNGATDASAGSTTFTHGAVSSTENNALKVMYIANLSGKEKLFIHHCVDEGTAGAGTAPEREEGVSKWSNTSNPIDIIQGINFNSGSFASGAEVVVLGWDPADTHTTNFWEELASVELGSAGDTIDSGTITAKKYLWVQCYNKASGNAQANIRFNSDSGGNYARRFSNNGGADGTDINQDRIKLGAGSVTVPYLTNFFVVNNSSNEKLVICNTVGQNTAGAGNAPDRAEIAGKWANTSSQITSVQITNDQGGDFDTGSILKVWGSD